MVCPPWPKWLEAVFAKAFFERECIRDAVRAHHIERNAVHLAQLPAVGR
jgi:hypothetical protein